MFGFKNIWPRLSDWILVKNSTITSFKVLPKLIQINILIIIAFIILEVVYFHFFFPNKEFLQIPQINEIFQSLTFFVFSLLQWAFLIFLVPFHLYNKSTNQKLKFKTVLATYGGLTDELDTNQKLKFKPFLARSIWPIIIDPIKAFFVVLVFIFLSLILSAPVYFFAQSNSILLYSMIFIVFLPTIIKALQFSFIPMVIFFCKDYIENKKSSLQLSIQVCRGLPIVLIVYWIIYFTIVNLIERGNMTLFSGSGIFSKNSPLFYTVKSFLSIILIIYSSSVSYFIYAEKDRNRMI